MVDDPGNHDDEEWGVFVYDLRPQPTSPQPWWKRHATALRETGLGSVAFACALAAWTLGGDMVLTAIVIWVGLIAGAIGLVTAPQKTTPWKLWRVGGLFLFFLAEGGFLYSHFHGSVEAPSLLQGASINFSIPPVEKMPNGSNILRIRVTNSGDTPMLNFSYHYGQTFSRRLLTAVEENDLFNEYVGSKFYPDIEKATPEQRLPDDIFSSLVPGGYFELSQPNKEYNDDQIQQMTNEELFVYDFLIVRYTDKLSMKKTYYYAEYCAQRLFIGNTINPCGNHNFLKHPGK
jgi:hypothetical protein